MRRVIIYRGFVLQVENGDSKKGERGRNYRERINLVWFIERIGVVTASHRKDLDDEMYIYRSDKHGSKWKVWIVVYIKVYIWRLRERERENVCFSERERERCHADFVVCRICMYIYVQAVPVGEVKEKFAGKLDYAFYSTTFFCWQTLDSDLSRNK